MSFMFYDDRNAFNPSMLSDNVLWLEADFGVTTTFANTFAAGSVTVTVTGNSGTSALVSNADLSEDFKCVDSSSIIRLNGTDLYTVDNISTNAGITTINTTTPLIANYTNVNLQTQLVSQVLDRSANQYNATGSQGPRYLPRASNGKAAFLASASNYLDIAAGICSISLSNNTIFLVSKTNKAAVGCEPFSVSDSGGNGNVGIGYVNLNEATYHAGGYSFDGPVASVTQTTFNVLRGRRSGSTQGISVNNGIEVTNSNAVDLVTDSAFLLYDINYGETIGSQFQAVIAYSRSLSNAECATVYNYLRTKYGII